MLGSKYHLFTGIVLLIVGVALRILHVWGFIPVVIIFCGAISKFSYVGVKVKRGEYKPGYEIILLYIGLVLFFTGIYGKSHFESVNPYLFIFSGVCLKALFVILFIIKTREQSRLTENLIEKY